MLRTKTWAIAAVFVWRFMQVWNQENGAVQRSANFTLGFLTATSNKGHGKLTGGAFFLALEHLNANQSDNNVTAYFNYVFRDTQNMDTTAMRAMVDTHCSDLNVSVYIGPPDFCGNAALLATAFDVPYISYDCNEMHTLMRNMTDYLIINEEPSGVYVSKFITALLQAFGWESYWVVTGQEGVTNVWGDTTKILSSLGHKYGITRNGITHETLNDVYKTDGGDDRPYFHIVRQTFDKTRVYVFLGNYNALVDFLRELQQVTDKRRGEYVVVAVDDHKSTRNAQFHFLRNDESNQNATEAEVSAFRNVLILKMRQAAPELKDFSNEVYERNYRPPVNLSRPPGFLVLNNTVSLAQPKLRPEAFYIYDAVMHYGQAVRELLMSGQDAHNGTLVIDKLRNSKRKSIQGFEVFINEDGESEGSYVVMSVATQDSDMWQVGNFTVNLSDSSVSYTPGANPIAWIYGTPPRSKPRCGFKNETCQNDVRYWEKPLIFTALALSLMLAVGTGFLILRHVLYEQRLDRLSWKIEFSAIQLLDAGQVRQMISPGRPRRKVQSRWKAFLASTDMAGGTEWDRDQKHRKGSQPGAAGLRVGVYKGSHVAVRLVARKNVEVNRALKKALMTRKEMNHENINRFIGACIDPPHVYIVNQFCSRHSLQDILRNEDSPLDDMFITSLVQDLYKGMTFIHESEFVYHGNLKSSKCLVDSRWVLKINDFGLGSLMAQDVPEPSLQGNEYCAGLLWRAPELLRKGAPPPEGSQKGDVYSFAIILYELYGRRGPWGEIKVTSSEIVRRLRVEDYTTQNTTQPFRPDTSVLRVKPGVIPLMHECWHPDPEQRPDFKNGIRMKLKPLQQGLLKSNIIDNMLAMMEKHAQNLEAVVAERTEQLSMEKRMTENLLLRMLPRSVAELLKHGQPVAPEQYDQVSIYFSDIVGFTELSAQSTPMQIVDMLNDLYTCFDSILENYDVYKVETIGDAYMVVSGLPLRNGMRHAGEIASMSLHVLAAVTTFRIRHRPEATLKIRIGIHTGPCCAGVVGLKMPRYCLFGDTVNTASRLESTGEALKIHCSQECRDILEMLGGYHLLQRGLVDMKGKGKKMTYFLLSEDTTHRMRRISEDRLSPDGLRDKRCVSAGNMDYTGKIFFIENGMVCKFTPDGGLSKKVWHEQASPNGSTDLNHVARPSLSSIASSTTSGTVTSLSTSQNGAGCLEEVTEMQCLLDSTRTKAVPASRPTLSMFSRDTPETHL